MNTTSTPRAANTRLPLSAPSMGERLRSGELGERGRWRGRQLVDATSAREHLQRLRQDHRLSHHALADLAGLSAPRIFRVLHSTPARPVLITRRSQRAILATAFDLDLLEERRQISSVGTVRRLQALCVQGWSLAYLARRRGVSRQALSQTMQRSTVQAGLAREVRRLYQELAEQPGPSTPTATRARERHWLGSEAWSESTIDDPSVVPETLEIDDDWTDHVAIERFLAADPAVLNDVEAQLAWQRARARQLSQSQMADLFGVCTRTIERWCARGRPTRPQQSAA